jgi:hypothetical protein
MQYAVFNIKGRNMYLNRNIFFQIILIPKIKNTNKGKLRTKLTYVEIKISGRRQNYQYHSANLYSDARRLSVDQTKKSG